ncbi:MAG: polysaccharide pyruvyl transferase family protein [Calothrix sp. MO_167.B12]|nr:polysaccharide pyruvyl transferase family protein [Calothrix sp. MO_167.B12]
MKKIILSILIDLYTSVLRRKKKWKLDPQHNLSVLILPPGDIYNLCSLGDEAMVTATVEYYRQQGAKKIDILSFGFIPPSENLYAGYPEVTIIKLQGYIHFANLVSKYDIFLCPGADVMDGYYNEGTTIYRLKLTSIADQAGVKSSILGFSWNDKPTPGVIKTFQSLPDSVRLCARDPVSSQRLIKYLSKEIELVADLAFLLSPNDNTQKVLDISKWIDRQKADGRMVIGINANYNIVDRLKQETTTSVVQMLVRAIIEVYTQNNQLSFILIPHDFRTSKRIKDSDLLFANAIHDALPEEIQKYCQIITPPCRASEVKSICGKLDFVLTGRMHLAIASLGQGTPAAGITYQGKFEGLYQHFELEGMIIEPEQACQPGNLSKFLLTQIEKQEENRIRIKTKLPAIEKLAKANLERIDRVQVSAKVL